MNTGGFSQPPSGKTESGKQDKTSSATNDQFTLQIPQINLPKGGGAIKQIDEKFQVNPVNGTASFSIPLPFSKPRNDFVPSLSLGYDSGSGNGSFGLGWNIGIPCIQRKTDKQLPLYNDAIESDTFLFSGLEDLVPVLKKNGTGNWVVDKFETSANEEVQRYRPRIEGGFSRIEKITPANSGAFYWRVTTGNNVVTIFGKSSLARIADPNNVNRIFKWLPELSYDDRGNCFEYNYVPENFVNVPHSLPEQNRLNNNATSANTYLKRIKYGNKNPYQREAATAYDAPLPTNPEYLFEMVLDYGDHDDDNPDSAIQNNWPCRLDPFSGYHAGFEIRTYRLCKRILFFHYFKELNDGINFSPCLVRSLDLFYKLFQNTGATLSQLRNAEADYIVSIQQSGYIKKADGTYSKKSLPPVMFSYQELQWNKNVQSVSIENIEHDPIGVTQNYQWTDLWSEGVSGMLTEQASGWYYKSNLGDGKFSIAQPVVPKPSYTGLQQGVLQLQDLESDGRKFIVNLDPATRGSFEIGDDNEWLNFRTFEQFPNVNFNDPNTKLIDLDGDGKPELVISEESVFIWYPNKGIVGYDSPELAAKPIDEEKGAALVFNDGEQCIFLASMSGDGLTDIVRIRNGEVCYWPNLGYGKFGAKVNMDFAPVFDAPDQFNPAYLHLADVSGTGATDIVYLGQNKFKAWLNLSGNAWSEVQEIDPFPSVELPNQVAVIDFLGNGTGCIVWSSALPGNVNAPLRYIDLMGGMKPYIMIAYRNNFGKEVSWEYKSSSHFYLSDKLGGKPWITKLPFPVQCVSKTKMNDLVTGTHFTNEYSYHHGYYDHPEREFRGFGRMEQTDTEEFSNFKLSGASNVVGEDLHQPPVKTITWYHTGAYLNQQRILDHFEHEYNSGPLEFSLPKPLLSPGLTPNECREALRACKGMVLRQEIYSLDGSGDQANPYSVATHNNLIKMLQPQQENSHAVFYVHESEAVSFYYERNLDDPRIAHMLNLEIDDFGNLLKSASIVYGRKITDATLPSDVQADQRKVHVVFTANDFTNDFDLPDTYRLKTLAEMKAYELTHVNYNTTQQFTINSLLNDFTSAALIRYEEKPDGSLQKRVIEQVRQIFLGNDLVATMPFKQIDTLGFLYQSYKLALTPSLIATLYGGRVSAEMLADAKYVQADGLNWWISSGRKVWLNNGETTTDARLRFYSPASLMDPFGIETKLTYDDYFLLVTSTEDALHNLVFTETIDYRTLSATKLKDINESISEIITDELGMVIATSAYGNEIDGLHGDGPLSTFDVTIPLSLAEVIGDPNKFLQSASSFFYYDLFAWMQRNQPACFATIARETHVRDLNEGEQTKVFLSVGYSSGLGQNLQIKVQAEPGEALRWQNNSLITVDTTPNLRWVGTGRTIFNNKGKPIKQYEPFFSSTYEYESEQELVEIGFSSTFYYDPHGRNIRVVHPNGTLARTEFDAWKQISLDENDTVLESSWYSDRGSPDPILPEPADSETRAAWLAARHANTPTQAHLDSLGRVIYTISDNGNAGKYFSRSVLDIENNQLQVTDARNNTVMLYAYDMISGRVHQNSMDSGERWIFSDAMIKPIYAWDSRGHRFKTEYDLLHRLTNSWLLEDIANSTNEKLIGVTIYGENQVNDKQLKLRGRTFQVFDQSGLVQTPAYDFKGNTKNSFKQLTIEYKIIVDWNVPEKNALLEKETFNSSSKFDAVNKPVEIVLPDLSKVMPLYNEANLLKQVNVFIQRQAITVPFVQNINYNAKAQRERILYGNQTATRYDYDPKNYRLTRLLTTRNLGSDTLQDLNYTYDPVGNITTIRDAAQQTIFFNNAAVDPVGEYEYDAIYRLIHASGREHAGQNAASDQFDMDKTSLNGQGLTLPGDMNAMQRYEEQYEYDEVGNMLRMIHNAGNGIFSNKWTRVFSYSPTNNQLEQTQTGSDTTNYHYDLHGNLGNLQNGSYDLMWNYADQLQEVALGGGGIAYYIYDGQGQRVRKIIENSNLKKERIYFGPFEVYREMQMGALILERETLHIMDDKTRIALVETRTTGNDIGLAFLIRYQYNNHLGTATLETDDQANIISYEEFYPFGSTAYQATRNQTDMPKRYRYTGKERDDESGLYYHGARYYAPWLARWTVPDPIGIRDGLNVYSYVSNNPLRLVDPNGTDGISVFESDEWKSQVKKGVEREFPQPLDVDEIEDQRIKNKEGYISEYHFSDVGIAKGEHIKEYIKSMALWHEEYWNLFDESGKMALLQSIINRTLSEEGLPGITVKQAAKGEPSHFSRTGDEWSLYITRRVFTSDLSALDFSRFVATAYHEARHSEQAFRAIQFALQTNKEIPENAAPQEIIDAAKKAVKEHPLVPGTDEYKFAALNYEYQFGEKKSYEESVYKNLETSGSKLEDFVEKNKDFASPGKKGKLNELIKGAEDWDKKYVQLPGESDSFLTMHKVFRLWNNRNKPAPFNDGLTYMPEEKRGAQKIPEPQRFIFPR